ncbi:disrupted in renal carcinoma protein 2-like protein [Elysia marginata]|uniref:Disrupted in renal carcinoma protein 2-like protein n=1 Tax=Elysia marginata TaxID=1093978 RepID=A0AAV4FJK5_9GAST|nr:disrupted in renal carcinoma protein 2-like protein [Elysia marginata]
MEEFPESTNVAEREPLVPRESDSDGDVLQIKTYKRRWYILVLFSLVCFTQGLAWNTFGPIATSSKRVFGWEDSTIAWLSALGGISFLITAFPVYWLMQVKGLRWVVFLSSLSLLVGSALRVITSDPQTATVLIYFGQFIAGFATPVSMGASPTLSATWFPQQERVTATAIASSIGGFGVAITFVLGPFIVERNLPPEQNTTAESIGDYNNSLLSRAATFSFTDEKNSTDPRLEAERNQIMQYMYIQCAWAGLLFLAIVCYFPSAPPLPPSISAHSERQTYWSGIRSLFRNSYFLIISLTYGCSVGVFGAWQRILSASVICGGTCLLAATPMMFELGCEIGYPASESATNGMFAFFNNLTGVAFMIPFAIPHVGTMWMNWVLTGCCLICLPLIFLMKTSFNRLDLDEDLRRRLIVNTNEENQVASSGSSRASSTSSQPRLSSVQGSKFSAQHNLGNGGSETVVTPAEVHVSSDLSR